MIPWDEVTLDQGTGVVHIAPGCGGEDFELSKVHNLDVLTPVDEAGRFYDDYGWLHGLSTVEAADQLIGNLGERGLLVESGLYEHAYPHCWRCDTPLIFRLSDDWFISVEELRPQLLAANQDVEWTPAYMGKRMDDWLNNMGDWNISRRRYYGLPLPFYPCSCGHLNVIGSRAELEERATEGLEQLEELRRPWIDEVPIACESCGEPVRRVVEVGDVWLDAGIVPFSTLGWQNPTFVPQGYATGAAKGLTTADLHDHAYWEEWFPADWVSEMREQIRLWFYSQHFMSVVLTGRAPYRKVLGYEKMLDETGREMHGSWGNMIEAEDAFERMGADVMRWQFCAQPPDRNLLFGFGPGRRDPAQAAHALELGAVPRRLRSDRAFPARVGCGAEPARPPSARPLAARADERARARGDRRLRGVPDGRRDARLRGVRRRSLELVHPPLAAPLLGRRPDGSARALVRTRAIAPRCRADPAVPHRASLGCARARCGRKPAALRPPRGLAGGADARRRPARGGRRGAPRRRARPPGPRCVGPQAAPAAAAPRRRGRPARARARGRAPRGAAREGGRVRPRRGDRAAREAAPAGTRPQARQGARRGPGCAGGGGVRGARRRRLPGARSRPRGRRGARRALGQAGLGRRLGGRRDRRTRHHASTRSSSSRAASTTSSTRSTRCASSRGSS